MNQIKKFTAKMALIPRNRKLLPRHHFWASECSVKLRDGTVIGKCLRDVYYSFKKIPPTNPPDERGEMVFETGRRLEAMMIDYFKEVGIWRDDHVKGFDDEHNISYEIDCLIDLNGGRDISNFQIVELKTVNSYGFEDLQTSGYPKLEHLVQLGIYLNNEKLETGFLFYLDKNTQRKKIFQVHVENDKIFLDGKPFELFTMRDVWKRLETLRKHIENNEPPPRDFCKRDWQCKYCGRRDYCWSGFNDGKIK